MTLAAVLDVVAGEHGAVQLWLAGSEESEPALLVGTGQLTEDAGPPATVIRTDRPLDYLDPAGRPVTAVPVHERGRTLGALTVARGTGRPLGGADRENLLLFAEQVNLALTDARNASDMEAARHDALTGLAGRALFHERLQGYLAADRGAGRVALLFVDLDRFKAVNDTLGHAAGDMLLMDVTRRLQAAVRQSDLVGRLGGDEFAVVLSPATPGHATEVAARIIDEISQPYSLADGRFAEVGASVGIALNTDDDEADLIRRADVAMYRAKKSGRGRYIVAERNLEDGPQRRAFPALPPTGSVAA
jgi:diguanylate cyclase (GGDEF)-like protein